MNSAVSRRPNARDKREAPESVRFRGSKALVSCAVFLAISPLTAIAEPDSAVLRRAYAEARFGQVHMYTVRPADLRADSGKTPLVFLHQNPRPGIEFKPLLLEMGRDRLVIAMDTPGYGSSDRPPVPPTMGDLAGSIADALDAMGFGSEGAGQVDLFGFHTGAFIAAELAILRHDLVRRVVMCGVAYFPHEERQEFLDGLPRDKEIAEDGSDVLRRWH